MKRTALKVIASILVFFISLFVSGFLMNKGNVNTTRTMERATLPVIYMNVAGEFVNELYGYTQQMDTGLLRDTITPLDEQRGVSFRIDKYGQVISDMKIHLRTVDSSRLIETIAVENVDEDDYALTANVNFKGLIEQYKEYSVEIELSLLNGRTAHYYTRVVDAPNYCAHEKLNFVLDFHSKEWTEETNAELKNYMESNYTGDNTTLHYVNIHSSMKQLAYGDLDVYPLSEPVASFKELAQETAVIVVKYLAGAMENDIERKYFVEEYYRIKYAGEVTYLLDYERTMNQITEEDQLVITESAITLGITDSDIGLVESEDGGVFAFVNAGKLYSYDISENKLSRLFTFYDEDSFDERTYHQDYDIKVLRIDETGNVYFLVYGYQNRGTYEGRVGISFYVYDGVNKLIEEKIFVGTDKTAEMIKKDVEQLSYLNKNLVYYFMLDRSIYSLDLATLETNVVVEGLEENMYSISESMSEAIWLNGNDQNNATSLNVFNLNTSQMSTIVAPTGEYIKPLAFMGEDFAYGLARKYDVVTDMAGKTTFPMYTMKIQNEFGELLKQYEPQGIYITNAYTKGNLLTLERVIKEDEDVLEYKETESDYLTNNSEQNIPENEVFLVNNEAFESVVRIGFSKDTKGKMVIVVPEEVIYEGNKEVVVNSRESDLDHYYVYYKGKLQEISTDPARAVKLANDNYGTVLNDQGYYVWYRANRELRNQIMSMSYEKTPEETNSLAYSIDMVLSYEGVVRNTEYLLGRGEKVLNIMEDALSDYDVLNLMGCSLDSILYYINRDIPVIVLLDDQNACMVIGYNQLSVVIVTPDKGTYKIGQNEAEEWFSKYGNRFITYVPNA